jgi:hypothetical protein
LSLSRKEAAMVIELTGVYGIYGFRSFVVIVLFVVSMFFLLSLFDMLLSSCSGLKLLPQMLDLSGVYRQYGVVVETRKCGSGVVSGGEQ